MAAPSIALARRGVSLARVLIGASVIAVIGYTYGLSVAAGEANPFNYFGYFTNQTSTLMALILIGTGVVGLCGRRSPAWLTLARAVATSCMVIVGVIYNVLVPGTGSAPLWVSVILHILFPAYVLLDWFLVGDRPALSWRQLWLVAPFPLLWLAVVLLRGSTDGWVPYGFLLPENGPVSLVLHVAGLLGALGAAGALVWGGSRGRGIRKLNGPHARALGR